MFDSQTLALPTSYDRLTPAGRAPRLTGGAQPLRGAWRPMFPAAAPEAWPESPEPALPAAAPVSRHWWRSFLLLLGIGAPIVQLPAATRELVAAESPVPARIGRSFLGAYRKGRRAAEAGLRAAHCPYQARLTKEGGPVNALTRTFQRYWAEGLADALADHPERYV